MNLQSSCGINQFTQGQFFERPRHCKCERILRVIDQSHLSLSLCSISRPKNSGVRHDKMKYTSLRGFNLAFVAHAMIEIPAAINFMFNPDKQLNLPAPQAHAIIRQYATLLASSVLISLVFIRGPSTRNSKTVAGSLSIYHIAPFIRSWYRLRELPSDLSMVGSQPFLYASVHLVSGIGLLLHSLGF